MKVFAIQHIGTGAYMPARMFRTAGAGWSYWDPTPAGVERGDGGFDAHPRIFFTLQSARNAATAWSRGAHHRNRGESYSVFEGPEYYDEMVVEDPASPRLRSDLRIVELDLSGL